MHTALRFGNAVIMASDGMPDNGTIKGDAFNISIACPNVAEAERIFNELSKDSKVIIPFAETFWNAKFGMFANKFGVRWMVISQLDGQS